MKVIESEAKCTKRRKYANTLGLVWVGNCVKVFPAAPRR